MMFTNAPATLQFVGSALLIAAIALMLLIMTGMFDPRRGGSLSRFDDTASTTMYGSGAAGGLLFSLSHAISSYGRDAIEFGFGLFGSLLFGGALLLLLVRHAKRNQ